MSGNAEDPVIPNLVSNVNMAWDAMMHLPKDQLARGLAFPDRTVDRFSGALLKLYEKAPELARQHARAYNSLVDGLPHPCVCMYWSNPYV